MRSFILLTAATTALVLAGCKPEGNHAKAGDTPPHAPGALIKTGDAPASTLASQPDAGSLAPGEKLPPEMIFAGQPIDPMCFQSDGEDGDANGQAQTPKSVALNACREAGLVVDPKASLTPDAEGRVGYSYSYQGDSVPGAPLSAFVQYRYLGQAGGHLAVLTVNNGGGSGTFTAVETFDRHDDTIQPVKIYASGDRCNGGITDAHVSAGVLHYSVNVTPPDILGLAGMSEGIAPYEDLESSATSCFGTADYQDGVLKSITLNPHITDQDGWTGNYKYQACFNQLQREATAAGQVVLDGGAIKAFAGRFKAACLHK